MSIITIKTMTDNIVDLLIDKYSIDKQFNKKHSVKAVKKYIDLILNKTYDECTDAYYSSIEDISISIDEFYMITAKKIKDYIIIKAGVQIIEKASVDADKIYSELIQLEEEIVYE